MSLKNIPFKSVYRSEDDDLLSDFYIPALSNSNRYDRAVGFFSAGMLSYAAKGLSTFVNRNGYVRLIFGGELAPEDYASIKLGYDLRAQPLETISNKFAAIFDVEIDRVSDATFTRRLELLSYLIANGQLEIKVALRRRGMYHEKIGIFTDEVGDKVIFQGSANETSFALLPDFNFESINVFQSWRPELEDHFKPYLEGFERLWKNEQKNTLVIDFPTASKNKLINIAKHGRPPITSLEEVALSASEVDFANQNPLDTCPRIPRFISGETFEIREHQRTALNAWKSNDLQGIMALATGAGKTITAIYGAVKAFDAMKRLFVVIAVPYQSLADQWVEVLGKFNVYPSKCYASSQQWVEDFTQKVGLYRTGSLNFVCAVVVNKTLQSDLFQTLLLSIPESNFLWIGDECHHHSSENISRALPKNARMRLGLSATPNNLWNDESNQRLLDYYGPVVAEYPLDQALRDGVLTPYKYFPIPIDLTESESIEYEELSKRIARIAACSRGSVDPESNESLKLLLIQRSRIIGKAENKLVHLRELLENQSPQPLSLFYCGDGSSENEISGETERQVDLVSKTLFRLGWRCSHFTARESRNDRQATLDNFRTGQIDAMVAIKCLDEGIDVPACRTAYILASSRNPKQFIQRRGRILRRSPGKEHAEIYDFIVKIPYASLENSEFEKRLSTTELERVIEFGSLSMNRLDTLRAMRPVLAPYGLEHLITNLYSDHSETKPKDC